MPEDLSELYSRIEEGLGGAVRIRPMDEVRTPYHVRRPFGAMDLDIALAGGLPCGTVCQVFGPDGTGKNLLANMLIAETQAELGDHANIFYVTFGYKPDRDFMRKCGVKLRMTDDELQQRGIDPGTVSDADRGESVGNVVFIDIRPMATTADVDAPVAGAKKLTKEQKAALKAAKRSKDDVDAAATAKEKPAELLLMSVVELIASGRFHVGIIDEMASGETRDDIKKQLGEDARVATWASLMAQFSKKVYTALRQNDTNGNPNSTCLLVLQPVRANLDSYTSKFSPWVIPSGTAIKHIKAVDIHLKPGAPLLSGAARLKVGKLIQWKLAKGKHGLSEGAEGELTFRFFRNGPGGTTTGGIDRFLALVNAAKAYGTVKRRGPNYFILDYEDAISGGIDGVADVLRDNSEITRELRAATLAAALQNQPEEDSGDTSRNPTDG